MGDDELLRELSDLNADLALVTLALFELLSPGEYKFSGGRLLHSGNTVTVLPEEGEKEKKWLIYRCQRR